MKWQLLYAAFGAVIGYYIFRAQNAAVHGELALEIHRNLVLADRTKRIAALLEKWESQGEGSKVVNLDFAKGIWYCLDELKDVLYAPSKGHA